MGKAMNWERARQRELVREPAKRKRRTVKVHPNSTAARKWGRSSWETDA